jgi:valine dehydrogenase (NAD+)
VFRLADEEGISPALAADRMAEERMRAVGRLATIRLPG